jgi:hypothetical protein
MQIIYPINWVSFLLSPRCLQIKEVNYKMKLGKIFVAAMFALLVMGIVFTAAADSQVSTASPSSSEEVFGVQPMAMCTYVCSYCLKFGHGGVCTSSGSCC